MIRKILEIDKEKCNGCGLCAKACHEGAIQISDGKACLVSDEYCDGLGDCLPHCPKDAIKVVYKDVDAYDHKKTMEHIKDIKDIASPKHEKSMLNFFPCKLRLVPNTSMFYDGAHILIAADCAAYSYASFHNDFMKKRLTMIACPKFDKIDYSEKLTEIFKYNDIKSITLCIMIVPCCSSIEGMIKKAIENSQKDIPFSVRIISPKGDVVKCY